MTCLDYGSCFTCLCVFIKNEFRLRISSCILLLQVEPNDHYVDSPPPYLILLHPALGPLWEVSRQKVSQKSVLES